jgi:hypothetical protein
VIARPTTRATGLIAFAGLVLTGCGIASGDETSKEYSQIQAANHRIGAIQIRNAFITSVPGTDAARTYLVVTLVNRAEDTDRLTGVTTNFGTATLDAAGGVPLPKGVAVQVSHPAINSDAPTLEISGEAPVVGTSELVSFTFANAGTTDQISVPVVSPDGSLTPTSPVPTDAPTFTIPIE